MEWHQIDKNWKQFKPKMIRKWSRLTEDDLTNIAGRRDLLEDRIHKRYGFSADHIRKEVDDWLRWQTLKSNSRKRTDLIRRVSVEPARPAANTTRYRRHKNVGGRATATTKAATDRSAIGGPGYELSPSFSRRSM
jgi:uncharacterized protein YjbJ (UPF0337 family)